MKLAETIQNKLKDLLIRDGYEVDADLPFAIISGPSPECCMSVCNKGRILMRIWLYADYCQLSPPDKPEHLIISYSDPDLFDTVRKYVAQEAEYQKADK